VELKDIAELMCEHCLAPDTSSKTGIGCDNMTVLIVAILHEKTKQEWYDWVTDRVKNRYGYATPDVIPQIYSQERLSSYRARREAMEERDRLRKERGEDGSSNSMFGGNSAFSGFARVLGSTGGISFHPGSGIMSDSGRLMFADNDEDDDDSSDEMDTTGLSGRSFFADTLGQHPRTQSTDGGASLRARLAALQDDDDEFDDEDSDKGYVPSTAHIEEMQDDEVTSPFAPVKSDVPKSPSPSPSPTNSRINGDITPVQQFKSPPLEDLDPALKVDDLMDSSQDHRKA
jgi:protein phosphatase 2C family protein 2/3